MACCEKMGFVMLSNSKFSGSGAAISIEIYLHGEAEVLHLLAMQSIECRVAEGGGHRDAVGSFCCSNFWMKNKNERASRICLEPKTVQKTQQLFFRGTFIIDHRCILSKHARDHRSAPGALCMMSAAAAACAQVHGRQLPVHQKCNLEKYGAEK